MNNPVITTFTCTCGAGFATTAPNPKAPECSNCGATMRLATLDPVTEVYERLRQTHETILEREG